MKKFIVRMLKIVSIVVAVGLLLVVAFTWQSQTNEIHLAEMGFNDPVDDGPMNSTMVGAGTCRIEIIYLGHDEYRYAVNPRVQYVITTHDDLKRHAADAGLEHCF